MRVLCLFVLTILLLGLLLGLSLEGLLTMESLGNFELDLLTSRSEDLLTHDGTVSLLCL